MNSTKRIKLTIEYEGTLFAGWQRQENALTIQEAIEEAIQKFAPLEEISLCVAGRTDAGVHALGQVAHIDLPEKFDGETVKRAINHYLYNHNITIINAEEVGSDFHARFSAQKRKYLYRILNRRHKPALDKNRLWHVPVSLDVIKMQEGANLLIGNHDFTSFRTIHCQSKSPIKTLDVFEVVKHNEVIECWVEAPSFLHHQVRNMVGTLVEIGKGRWEPEYIKDILKARDRSAAGPTAPPEGLYFVSVTY